MQRFSVPTKAEIDTYSKHICYLGSILIYIAFVKSVQYSYGKFGDLPAPFRYPLRNRYYGLSGGNHSSVIYSKQSKWLSTRVFQKPSCLYAGVAQLVEQSPWGGRLRVSPFRLKPKEITVQICSFPPVSDRSGVQVRPPAPLFDIYYNLCYNIYIKQALTAIYYY